LIIASDVNGTGTTTNFNGVLIGIKETLVDDNDAQTANSCVCKPSNCKHPLKFLYVSKPEYEQKKS
jgi:hypothetical protein